MNAVAESSVLDMITATVASTLKIPIGKLDVDASFDSFGMDSIIAIELMTNLTKQLKISITPAQLTTVRSIRELAAMSEAAMNAEAAPAPAPKAQGKPAAPPVPSVAKVVPRRTRESVDVVRPGPASVSNGAGPLRQALQLIKARYGIDLSGERFASREALIDHLVEHHAEALSDHYGLARDEENPGTTAAAPAPTARHEQDVAIVGMACRFADAPTPNALWQNLVDERSSITVLAGDRWHRGDRSGAAPLSRWGALIQGVACFDAEFFGLPDKDAILIDPQERLVMQALYHALQHAGIRADKLRGSRTALFLGYEYSEYEHHLRSNLHRIPDAPVFSSSSPIYYLANRISFLYDFKGPSEVVNASCASSALAIHRACQSLARGECDLAIAGGVSLNLFGADYAAISHYGLLSPDGSCGVFDDNANGFTRGEGLGLLVLKRTEDAERDNNRVFAKVIATHQNNRGRAAFLSEIKHEAITEVIRECYERHAVDPSSVHYIEVDGYATKWGDSFEFEGIKNALQPSADGSKRCALGSIKGSIGHVEPASGVASAIKLALSLHHKQFPATITKKTLSSFIDVEAKSHPLYIADRPLPFDELRRQDEAIRAGINSFADSGVNVHLLLQEYPTQRRGPCNERSGPQVFIFSAKTSESMRRYLDSYIEYLTDGAPAKMIDLAYTLQIATEPMEQRLAVVASSQTELLQLLPRAKKLLLEDKPADGKGPIFIGKVQQRHSRRLLDMIKEQISEDKLIQNLRNGQFNDVGMLWASGIDIPWETYWHESAHHDVDALPQIIDIPPYPFAKKRYWLDFDGPAKTRTAVEPESARVAAVEPSIAREWRFTVEPSDAKRAEVLDAEEKIRLFVIQETAVLLRVAPESVGDTQNFLQLGFDSVVLTTLIQRLIDLLKESISPSIFFKYQDISRLSGYLAERYREKLDGIHVVKEVRDGPPAKTRTAVEPESAKVAAVEPSIVREWRFTVEPNDAKRAEVLDAEEKIRLFVIQETAILLRVAQESVSDTKNFLQLGFNEPILMSLIQRLTDLLEDNISTSIFFKHQDISRLSGYLAGRYREKLNGIQVVWEGASEARVAATSTVRKGTAKTGKSDLETWFVNREAIADSRLVPMQTNASGTPVFAVPGADGSVLSLEAISRAFQGLRPMFAFEAVGLDGSCEPLASIREMAEANIEELKAMRDIRRLDLLGLSNGAVTAFEMARRLGKKNIAVDRLVLLDCRCPASTARNEVDEISDAFVNLIHSLGGQKQLNVAEFKEVTEARRARYLYELMKENGFGISEEHFMLAYRISVSNEKACRNYRPSKIKNVRETIVVRATKTNGSETSDLGWNRFLETPARCIDIDTDHFSLLHEEAGVQIAHLFR